MKAIHGTAIYTGGGIYVAIGELDNGYYFYGSDYFCSIFDEDTRTYNFAEDGLACFWNDWCAKHEVKSFDVKEINDMFEDFCKRLDKKESGLTNGYEKYSNYLPGEVWNRLSMNNRRTHGNV